MSKTTNITRRERYLDNKKTIDKLIIILKEKNIKTIPDKKQRLQIPRKLWTLAVRINNRKLILGDLSKIKRPLRQKRIEPHKKKVLERAEHRCQLCNKKGKLYVHNRDKESKKHKDLIALCINCCRFIN